MPTAQGAEGGGRKTERPIAVAFGSNLGDRREAILAAADEVSRILSEFQLSFLIETAPVGAGLENDPLYLNAAGVGRSTRSSRELLDAFLAIEQRHGRTRPRTNAPRTLDLDLILAGDEIVDEPGLRVPHPRFRERVFVLEPLATIAPDLIDPVTGKSIVELWRAIITAGR
ncbi:MAG: 2-amino-4-hydroxy-6-hydroxymethyldihydropteridine diphosphokinase [Acidobacteria bacterium]|nr:MAG: 2-amino-4-hydroxy-6-hydroxymethyldihydropteridine diphosphokinase [Acidobacteriota bacterium]